ncbi:MAG TPA: hypothetical protein V6D47_22555, partial [Oscillatoriaceae cyanobacterium]
MSNRIVFLRWLAVILAMVLVTACMQNFFDAREGKVAISVMWPRSGYHVQEIPEGSVNVKVAISGDGLDNAPITTNITPNGADTSTDYMEVPIGPKVVQAFAYDLNGRQTAAGQAIIDVRPNALTEADVTLTPTSSDATGTPGASGTASPTPSPDLVVQTVAGNGLVGAQDGADPLAARFKYPESLALDDAHHALYIADTAYQLIRRYDLITGAVTTLAGEAPSSDTTPSPSAAPALLGSSIGTPAGLALAKDGTLYFCDRDNDVIRKLGANGGTVVVAGSGKAGDTDGPAGLAAFDAPSGIAVAQDGTLYVSDTLNQKIRRITPDGVVTTFAGTGTAGSDGDGAQATDAKLNFPGALAVGPLGDYLYVADMRQPRIRRINLQTGIIETVAGNGQLTAEGEGGPALQASLTLPTALAFTPDGQLVIAEGWVVNLGSDTVQGVTSRILEVTKDGNLVRIAGQHLWADGFGGDGGDALLASFDNPAGLAIDSNGQIYVA